MNDVTVTVIAALIVLALSACTHQGTAKAKSFDLRLEFTSPECQFILQDLKTRDDESEAKELRMP